MKKRIIICITSIVMLLTISIVAVYAWYINTNRTGKIVATTNGIIINYRLNGSDYNVLTHDITGLAFFDKDEDSEGRYFSTMAYEIEVDITNLSSQRLNLIIQQCDLNFSYEYDSTKSYVRKIDDGTSFYYEDVTIFSTNLYYKKNNVNTQVLETDTYDSTITYFKNSACTERATNIVEFVCDGTLFTREDDNYYPVTSAYVDCLISLNKIDTSSYTESVEDFATANDLSNSLTVTPLSAGGSKVYLYVFGVQLDDKSNSDFLKETYTFSFSLEAVPSN